MKTRKITPKQREYILKKMDRFLMRVNNISSNNRYGAMSYNERINHWLYNDCYNKLDLMCGWLIKNRVPKGGVVKYIKVLNSPKKI